MQIKIFKKLVAIALSVSLVTLSLGGCGSYDYISQLIRDKMNTEADNDEADEEDDDEEAKDKNKDKNEREASDQTEEKKTQAAVPTALARPSLLEVGSLDDEMTVTPSVEPYTIAADLSNTINISRTYLEDEAQALLAKNGFVVSSEGGKEFFEVYETNRYTQYPSFVTVDSMMHTYHLYFSYLLKNTEKNYLSDMLEELSNKMLNDSLDQYGKLKGSEWEDAAARNVAFFTIGAKLLNDNIEVNSDVKDTVVNELNKINSAEGIENSLITDEDEDYSQYKPRGYYEGDERLEAYFRAMMWYGRIHFKQDNEELDKSALLITKAMSDDTDAYDMWSKLYAVTSFFAGASDDLGVCEYSPVMDKAYGENFDINDLIGNDDGYLSFRTMTGELSVPIINSVIIQDGEDNTAKGFRFMGQRFSIDASIMENLVYSNVGENSNGDKRMLPDVLDVPAALGSDTALKLLEDMGAMEYDGYSRNMKNLRKGFENADNSIWTASLYANWLNTLNPLLEEKGEGYPIFMQNEEWTKKNLECYAGSYTELKHDTVLYSKQVVAEMGGDWDDTIDDRGYVEPEPVVYKRFANLATLTSEGLDKFGLISSDDKENLSRLAELANQLTTMSNKELVNETLTDDEYELIRNYGGNLEHFWYEAVKSESDNGYVTSSEYPAALVVDIATDPSGTVLEAATGNASDIYVVVNVDGDLRIARGSVYSFYEFEQPLSDRLTDSQWRIKMGIAADDNYEYHYDTKIDQPKWTQSYRYNYEYNY
jgi:hypothetical protein